LIKRDISQYDAEDLFVGIYDNYELAKEQRVQYIKNCKSKDKWKEQTHK